VRWLLRYLDQSMLYSFIIPTRERHDVLEAAIRAVLKQTRRNFEVLVVDNAGSPETGEVVRSFSSEQVRYIRAPERLPMADNWELGLENANGDYIHVMGDDDGPLPDAVECAERIHAAYPDKILTWLISIYHWPDFYIEAFRNHMNGHLGSHLELRDCRTFLSELYGYRNGANFSELPSVYYSFVPRPLIEQIRAKFGRYFLSESPDIASGLVNAWHTKDYIFSYRPLAVLGISRHSTGTSSLFPHLNAGPMERFRSEVNASKSIALDPRLQGDFLVEVMIANELFRFRDTYFPRDEIVPDMKGLIAWFAQAASRFPDQERVRTAVYAMAKINGVDPKKIVFPQTSSMSFSSFWYTIGKHNTVFMRYYMGPHVRDIADVVEEWGRLVVAPDELIVSSITERNRKPALLKRLFRLGHALG
jgi:glycosyltransferase involved in cell wall biosynthesis